MNKKDYNIRLETAKDQRETENLTREAFWNVYRPGCTEHYVLHCFRDNRDFVPELNLVMEKDEKIIGHIMFAKAEISLTDGGSLPIMTFGPISIHPDFQRKGYGKALLDFALEKAAERGTGAVCIEGNIDFYSHCGFSFASSFSISYHGVDPAEETPFFLCRELKKGYLDGISGTYTPPQGYFVDDKEVEEFDKSFPEKIKLKLPHQLF